MATMNISESSTWTCEDFVDILARLEFIVEWREKRALTSRDVQLRQQEVLQELYNGMRKKYTVKQIRDRLWDEFAPGDTYPDENFPMLFIHGISEICTLDDETRELVREQLQRLRESTPRKPRQKSNPTGPPNSNLKTPSKVVKSPRKSRASEPHSRPLTRCSSIGSTGISKSRSQRRLVSRRRITLNELDIENAEAHSEPPEPSASRIVPDSFTTVDRCDRSPPATSRSPKRTTLRAQTPPSSSTAHAGSGELPDSTYEDILHEITYYKQLYEDAEAERKGWSKEKRRLKSFYKETKGIPQNMQRVLEKKDQKIDFMNKQRSDQDWLQPYLTLGERQRPAPNAGELHTAFSEMQRQFASLLVIPGFQVPRPENLRNSSADMVGLLENVFGALEDDSLGSILDVSAGEMVQALTGAAVCQWILRAEFRCGVMASTPLLRKYRHIISSICGEDGLANFDSAAHQSLIEEEYFRNAIIPRLASKHTERLMKVLNVFFDEHLRSDTTSKLRETLQELFNSAVHVRSLALIRTEYEDIWPSISAQFEERTMETDPPGKAPKKCQVRLPLVPGLRARTSANQMVDYAGSRTIEASTSSDVMVLKALVLV